MRSEDQHYWDERHGTRTGGPTRSPYPQGIPVGQSQSRLVWALSVVALCGWLLFVYTIVRDYISGRLEPYVPPTVTPRGDLAEDEQATIQLYNQSRPSVVHITTLSAQRNRFNLNVEHVPSGTGTGFIWDNQGHVVTNYHVIESVLERSNRVVVSMDNQKTYEAEVWGAYPDKDVAVLKVSAPRNILRPLPLGESSNLQVGQKVFAIGNPFGLDQTLTTGVISALGREIQSVNKRPIKGVIQTDAAINPGNSGGPLLDSEGRLIAVNTAIFSPSGAFAGIGFAIPIDEVKRVVDQLVQHRKIIKPGLGVQVATDQLAERFGIEGVLIVGLVEGGPAAQAGLQPTYRDDDGRIVWGDTIVSINGEEINSTKDLFATLDRFSVGDEVQVGVVRNSERRVVTVLLSALE